MLNIVLFGGPGSGKGTQSDKIVEKYGLHHISTGEVLRRHIKEGTEIGKKADEYISEGQLIPDEMMIDILEDVLQTEKAALNNGVIFDGFPRTIAQAEQLDKMLKAHGQGIDHVIGLEVPDQILTDRMLKRGAETGRADDNIDTIKQRLDVYHNRTSPLRDFYISDGRYRPIDGDKPIDEIFGNISDILGKPGS